MDLEGTPIEVAIVPYEVYTDRLYGKKTSFESFVTLKDPAASAALDKYKGYLRDMEANLHIPDEHKNFHRGFDSEIVLTDQFWGGDYHVQGVQTITLHLPITNPLRKDNETAK